MDAKKRIKALVDSVNNNDDTYKNDDLESVEDFIRDCGRYVERVTAMEAALQSARFRMEPEDYRDLIIELDRNRKLAHDALIASVRVIDRLCRVYDVEKVYGGPDERILIADFAAEVTQAYFQERKL